MSNRLESLNSKSGSGTNKPALRFKPKAVVRKTKEERDKEAPVVVKNENHERYPRNKGFSKSQRGGRQTNYSGTHLVLSGPLSSGSVPISDSSKKTNITFRSEPSSSSVLQSIREGILSASVSGSENFGDEDSSIAKIDMTQDYKLPLGDTLMFPVQPERVGIDHPKPVSSDSKSSSASKSPTPDIMVKEEPIEEKLEKIKEQKTYLETKITQTQDSLDVNDSKKAIEDQSDIVDLLSNNLSMLKADDESVDNASYVLFQLPRKLPTYEMEDSKPQSETDMELSAFADSAKCNFQGSIGRLNFHRSGKVTIDLGNDIELNLTKGLKSKFLQELVLFDIPKNVDDEMMSDVDEHRGNILHLGEIKDKIIATPSLI